MEVCGWGDRKAESTLSKLREYYRLNFKAGEVDESFLLWIEQRLNEESE